MIRADPGAFPPGLCSNRPYYVRDSDAGGYSLADAPGGAAISFICTDTGLVMGKPGLTPTS